MLSHQLTDPKLRRLKKALFKAERFMLSSNFSKKAVGRWNKIVNKAHRAMK